MASLSDRKCSIALRMSLLHPCSTNSSTARRCCGKMRESTSAGLSLPGLKSVGKVVPIISLDDEVLPCDETGGDVVGLSLGPFPGVPLRPVAGLLLAFGAGSCFGAWQSAECLRLCVRCLPLSSSEMCDGLSVFSGRMGCSASDARGASGVGSVASEKWRKQGRF